MRRLLPLLAVVLCCARAWGADPSLTWRTLDTPHFHIHFYEPNEDLARRVAVVAERAHRVLSPLLRHAPKERTHITITDDTDGANGYATVVPRNQIGLFATAPDALSVLNDHDDWLYGLVAHEYSHILHLDTIAGIPRIYNMIFGKRWAPNSVQPRWFIEGLATYQESRRTSGGRTRSALFDMYLRVPVLAGKPLDLAQMSSGPHFWPHGHAHYLYGGVFLKYIADRYGDDKIAGISHEYGRQPIPFGLSRAVARVVGKTYEALYDEWIEHLRARYELQRAAVARRGLREGHRVTDTLEYNVSPRFDDRGRLVWLQSGGYRHQSYRRKTGDLIEFEGGGRFGLLPGGEAMVAERGVTVRTYYSWNDLFVVSFVDGSERRLTHGARASSPDVSRDGRRVTFTVNGGSRQRLAVMDLADGAKPEILWEGGRWDQALDPSFSPDGKRIAFAAWTEGGYVDVFVTDIATRSTRRLTHDRAIDTAPRFTPDGQRLIFASDRTGIYNVFTMDLEGGDLQQVTNVLGGAFTPDLSPDGKTLVYMGFDGDGYDLYSLAFEAARWLEPEVYVDDRPDPIHIVDDELPPTPSRPYRAIETLGPLTYELRSSVDSFGSAVTVSTNGGDVAGRHGWFMAATYGFERGDVGFGLSYYYGGLWPSLGLGLGRWTGLSGGLVVDGNNVPHHAETWGGSVSLGLPVVREPDVYSDLAVYYELYTARSLDPPPMPDPQTSIPIIPGTDVFSGFTFRWFLSDARGYAYSLGPVEGRGLQIGMRLDHPAIGSDVKALQLYYRWDEYVALPWLHHVAAFRLGGGLGTNARYGLGGVPRQDLIDSILYSRREGTTWLRGYESGSLSGNQYHLLNFEYRVPVLEIEKGVSTLPFYFRRFHVAALVDVGNAFDGPFRAGDLRWAAGAALRLDMTFGYFMPGSFDLGYARGLSEGGTNEFWLLLTGGL